LSEAEITPEAVLRFKAEGDRLRDERHWKEAASSYATYLEAKADDWPIWNQYGHCLKGAGDLAGGLGAYRRALSLEQNNSDLHLQIGHALKLLGAHEDALEAYGAAFALDPQNSDAKVEIAAMQQALALAKAEAEKPKPPPRFTRLMFDVSDLIQYMKEWRIPTGIQRVQLNVIHNALTAFEALTKPIIIHFDQSVGNWRPISRDAFLQLHDAAMSSDGLAEEEFLALLQETEDSSEAAATFER